MEKQNLDPSLKASIETLRGNPIFRLSLGSKELFHSNFWAYLLTDFGAPLPAVRAFFGIPADVSVSVLREKNNFDLLISWNVGDKYFCLIIENKVKSLPNATQLKKYAEKTDADFLEAHEIKKDAPIAKIRLAVVAPKRLLQECCEEIKQGSSGTPNRTWETLSYENLAEAIKRDLVDVKDCHGRWLLGLYVDFLNELCKILNTIEIDETTSFFTPEDTLDALREIRIHDVYEKVWFAILKNKMRPVLNPTPAELYQIAYTNAGARLDFAFTRDETPSPSGKIFVLQFQRGKFCIGANPVLEDEGYFNDIIVKIFTELEFDDPVENKKDKLMHRFDNFRYRYVKIADFDDKSFASVAEKAKKAIEAMEPYKKEILDKLEEISPKKQKPSASK